MATCRKSSYTSPASMMCGYLCMLMFHSDFATGKSMTFVSKDPLPAICVRPVHTEEKEEIKCTVTQAKVYPILEDGHPEAFPNKPWEELEDTSMDVFHYYHGT